MAITRGIEVVEYAGNSNEYIAADWICEHSERNCMINTKSKVYLRLRRRATAIHFIYHTANSVTKLFDHMRLNALAACFADISECESIAMPVHVFLCCSKCI